MNKIKALLIALLLVLPVCFPVSGEAQSGSAQRLALAIVPTSSTSNFAQVVPFAKVSVCAYNAQLACNTPVSVYSDTGLSNLITQPVNADIRGSYSYYIQSGTQVIEKVCTTYNQCTNYAVKVGDVGFAGGTITGVTAGTGMNGGGLSGNVTLNCDISTISLLGCVKPDGSTVTIDVDGTIHSSATGGGGGFIPSGANALVMGDSRLVDDANVLGANYTATAISCTSGSVCTATFASNSLTVGQWVWWRSVSPSCLGPTSYYYGTNAQLYKVTAITSTTASFQGPSGCASATGTGGTVEDATYFVPVQLMSMPGFAGINALYLRNGLDAANIYAGNGGLICEQDTNYTNMIHNDLAPAITGKPLYVIEEGGYNDLGAGSQWGASQASIQTCFQHVWQKLHTDGAFVLQATIAGTPNGIFSISNADTALQNINTWIYQQGKSSALAITGQYVDGWIPLNEGLAGDGYGGWAAAYWTGHTFTQAGATRAAKIINASVQASGIAASFSCTYYTGCVPTNASVTISGNDTFTGNLVFNTGSTTFTHLRLNGQAQSTSVICPNGTSGDLTTSGCVPGDANGISSPTYAVGGGSAQAQTVTLAPAISTLSTGGLWVRWMPVASNSAADPTLAVNGLTATTIKKCGTTSLVAGDLNSTAVALAVYDGTNFQLINPQSAACGGGGGGGVTTLFGSSNPTGVNTPVIVQRASNNAVFGNPAVTFGSSVTLGHTIIVSISSGTCVNSPGTITDTRGTTFSLIVNAACSYVYAGTLTSTGADTITSSAFSGGGQPGASEFAVEVTNLTTTLDSSATSGSGNPITESYTSTAAQDLIMSVWQDTNGGFSGTSSTSGWTLTGYRGGNSNGQNQATQIGTTIGTYSITWTGSGSGSAAIFGIKAIATPTAGTEGQLYFQTSSNPYVCWIYHSSAWTMCGALQITATAPLRVNTVSGSAQTGTTFSVDCPTCAMTNISGTITPTNMTCTSSSCTATTQSTVTFANIPATGNGLVIRFLGVGSTSAAFTCVFNADTGTNYSRQGLEMSNGSLTGIATASQTGAYCGSVQSVGTRINLDIPFYAVSTVPRIMDMSAMGYASTSSTVGSFFDHVQDMWNNTSAAINSVKITIGTGTFTGTFAVYLVN